MRSRDGTKTICVVCEDQLQSPTAVSSVVPTNVTTTDVTTADVAPVVKDTHTPPCNAFNSYFASHLLEALLESLKVDESLQSIDTFCSILESALKPLGMLQKENFNRDLLASLAKKIQDELLFPSYFHTTHPIEYFNSIARLYALYQKFIEL